MGYSHQMNATITTHPGVTVAQITKALAPLSEYWGWDAPPIKSDLQSEGWALQYIKDQNGNDCLQVQLWTGEDVGYGYDNLVSQCAENLEKLCVADFFALINFDTADVENAMQRIWYGDPCEIESAKRKLAWNLAKEKLIDGGYSELEIEEIRHLISSIDSTRDVTQPSDKHSIRIAPANRP